MNAKLLMNKKVLAVGLPVLMLALVSAFVLYQTLTVDVTVNEALSVSSPLTFSLSGFSGETITNTVTVHNSANVPLDTRFDWTETSNIDGVVYTTDMSKIVTLAPLSNTDVDLNWVVETGSVTGTFNGEVTLTRL